jgi:hypothetical protein
MPLSQSECGQAGQSTLPCPADRHAAPYGEDRLAALISKVASRSVSQRSGVIGGMEIFTDVERRRRWCVEDKLRTVAETRAVRAGSGGQQSCGLASAGCSFTRTISERVLRFCWHDRDHLPDGSHLRISNDVSLTTLRRVIIVLRG